MRQVWLYILATALGLAGCDVGDRKEAAAIYKANAEAAKQCEAKLKGLKRVPIAGAGGKLFLDAERLPSWAITRSYIHFKPGTECGAGVLHEGQIFYWTGNEVVLQAAWLAQGHSLLDRPGPQDWFPVLASLVGIGLPKICNESPGGCEALVEQEERNWEEDLRRKYPVGRIVQLKHYPIDISIPVGWEANPKLAASLLLREWPKKNGGKRALNCSGKDVIFRSMTDKEIENITFDDKDPLVCQLDGSEFRFRWGSARIVFTSNDFNRITPILQSIEKYLTDSIIEGDQK